VREFRLKFRENFLKTALAERVLIIVGDDQDVIYNGENTSVEVGVK